MPSNHAAIGIIYFLKISHLHPRLATNQSGMDEPEFLNPAGDNRHPYNLKPESL